MVYIMNKISLEQQVFNLNSQVKDPDISIEQNLMTINSLLKQHPKNPELICMKADAYYEMASVKDMTNFARPIDLYKEALSICPDNYDTNTKIAIYIYSVQENYESALPYFEKSIKKIPDEEIVTMYADALANLDRVNDALDAIYNSKLNKEAIDRIAFEIKEEYT